MSSTRSTSGSPVIAITDLRKKRAEGNVVFELVLPKFTVLPGEFVAVVGASGCGKSTLLDMLGLVLKPDQAAAFEMCIPGGERFNLHGYSSRSAADIRRQHVGYVLQTGGLLDFLSLERNIALPLSMAPKTTGKSRSVDELAEQLGIKAQLKKRPESVSGGERQRAAIARALIHDPTLILADEPTAALDPKRARDLVTIFRRLIKERSSSVVMVTHDYNLVRGIADRVYSFEILQVSRDRVKSTCVETSFDALTADSADRKGEGQ